MSEELIKQVADMPARLTGIIWADAKVGKTTWACSARGRKLIINFDPDGFRAVAHRKDVDVIDLSVFSATEAIEKAKKAASYVLDSKDKYGTVIVDSLTMLTETALYDAVARKIGGSPNFTPTIDAPGLAGYGARNNVVSDLVTRFLRATALAGLDCWFLAHMDDPEYDKDGKTILEQTIMLSAKIRNKGALKVSEIYHMTTSNGRRKVYLAPYGVKQPMGSRIFDTVAFKDFDLTYNIEIPDEQQACSLLSITNHWKANNFQKLKGLPKL